MLIPGRVFETLLGYCPRSETGSPAFSVSIVTNLEGLDLVQKGKLGARSLPCRAQLMQEMATCVPASVVQWGGSPTSKLVSHDAESKEHWADPAQVCQCCLVSEVKGGTVTLPGWPLRYTGSHPRICMEPVSLSGLSIFLLHKGPLMLKRVA